MTNRDVLKEYASENWVVEEVLSYLLLKYKELVKEGKMDSTNIVGFIKNFMKEETLVYTDFAEISKQQNLEKSVVIDVEEKDIKEIKCKCVKNESNPFTNIKNECDGCVHKNNCGIDTFFMEELEMSDHERFLLHCVGCCCGDGYECNKNHGCENYEEEIEILLG